MLITKGERMEKNLFDLIIELKRGCLADEAHIRTMCDISLSEYKGLMQISIKESMTCNTLSHKMGLSPSRGSRIIDHLVRRGYFSRSVHPSDRRSFVISLSAEGIKIRKRIEQERNLYEEKIRKRFSQEELDIIKEALDLIADTFN